MRRSSCVNLLCDILAKPCHDHSHLRPCGAAFWGRCCGAGAVDQPLGMGPADGVHSVGTDLRGVFVFAQIRLICGVAALVLSVVVQDRRHLLMGDGLVESELLVVLSRDAVHPSPADRHSVLSATSYIPPKGCLCCSGTMTISAPTLLSRMVKV